MDEEKQAVIKNSDLVTLTIMNDISELQWMQKQNRKPPKIRKLDADSYVNIETGEVGYYEKTENRSQSYQSLRRSFKKMRYLINNNFTGKSNELIISLTYTENMMDQKKLYKDFEKFMKSLRYKYRDKTTIDYINVVEPQERGAWHTHTLLRFNDVKYIYISREEIRAIWKHGVEVDVRRPEDVDDIGAYLTAYLTDLELSDENMIVAMHNDLEVVEKEVEGVTKRFIKGGRLHLYPPQFKLLRKSKGMKYPDRETMTYKEAIKKVGSVKPHYEKTYNVETDNFTNQIKFEQRNSNRL